MNNIFKLANNLNKYFAPSDYKYLTGNNSFIKQSKKVIFKYAIKPLSIEEGVTVEYAIQFLSVNKILCSYSNVFRNYDTIYISVDHILDSDHTFYFSEMNTQEISLKIIKIYEVFAIPYFEKYNSLFKLNELVNKTEYISSKYKNFLYHNTPPEIFFVGLIVGFLLQEDVASMIKKHLKFFGLNDYPEIYRNEYHEFLKFFNKYITSTDSRLPY